MACSKRLGLKAGHGASKYGALTLLHILTRECRYHNRLIQQLPFYTPLHTTDSDGDIDDHNNNDGKDVGEDDEGDDDANHDIVLFRLPTQRPLEGL